MASNNDAVTQVAVMCLAGTFIVAGLMMGAVFLVPIGLVVFVLWLVVRAVKNSSIRSAADARLANAQATIAENTFPEPLVFARNLIRPMYGTYREVGRLPAYDIFLKIISAAQQCYEAERLHEELEPTANDEMSLARWRDEVKERAKRVGNSQLIPTMDFYLRAAFEAFLSHLPDLAFESFDAVVAQIDAEQARPGQTIPLSDLIPSPAAAIESLIVPLCAAEVSTLGAFGCLRQQLQANFTAMGEVLPKKSKATGEELIAGYLGGTPLLDLFSAHVPFSVPDRIRFEHTHILGGSGHGKSTLIAQQLLADLAQDEPPALIIIDGKGTFYDELTRFALFAPGTALSDKLVLLDPRDIEHPPALNMFSQIEGRDGAPAPVRLQIQEETINSFSYVFGASDFAMTEKQETCLSYAARILFKMPQPTLQTLLDILSDPIENPKTGGVRPDSPFKPYIDQLAQHHQDFMRGLFYHPTEYNETKRQLRNRIYSLLKHPSFAAMFLTKERRIDLFDIIQNRKILLVNASPAAIGETGAQLLGRYIIAQALTSAYGRLSVPKSQWAPAHLIVDEAQMFIDEDKTQPLLQQAREFNLGVTLAHQKLDDLTPKLRATVAANTSIRYVGGVSHSDASFMAKNMHCETDFIMAQRKSGGQTHFATYVRGYTDRAVSLSVPLGVVGAQAKMSEAQESALIERNRALVGARKTQEARPTPEPTPQPHQPETRVQGPPVPDSDTHTGTETTW